MDYCSIDAVQIVCHKKQEKILQNYSMQKIANSAQAFYIKKKLKTKNYQSVEIRKQSSLSKYRATETNNSQKRNAASMYLSKQKSTQSATQNNNINSNNNNSPTFTRNINTAMNMHQTTSSKSAYRYKRINFTQHKQTKYQNYLSSSIQDFKRKNQRSKLMNKVRQNENLSLFLNKVQQREPQFVSHCMEEEYEKAAEVIIILLNYTVDLNLVDQFSISLKTLADFYMQCGKINSSLFYYNETRQSALLLSQPVLLIQSLIGVANCCSKGSLEKEAISILKKALEYSWYYDKKQLQLQLYDEMGQKYYHLGDLTKAKKYHLRYINSIYEPGDSANKNLSRQRVKKNEQIHIELKYNELSTLFLVHLKVPIRPLKEVPPIDSLESQKDAVDGDQNGEGSDRVRDHFNISKKYFTHFQDIQMQMKRILKTWFFAQQMDEPPLPTEDWTAPIKLKKFAYIDFKLNQHLKKFTPNIEPLQHASKQEIQYKQTLEEKIDRKLKQPSVDPEWYEKMVQQIVRDHKNKLLNVRNAVRIRDYNKPTRPTIQTLKQVYNKFFQRRLQ